MPQSFPRVISRGPLQGLVVDSRKEYREALANARGYRKEYELRKAQAQALGYKSYQEQRKARKGAKAGQVPKVDPKKVAMETARSMRLKKGQGKRRRAEMIALAEDADIDIGLLWALAYGEKS